MTAVPFDWHAHMRRDNFFLFLVDLTFGIVKEIFPPGICEVTKQREFEV